MSCLHGNHEDDCDICAEVGAAWNSGYASGVKIEREACAKVCEKHCDDNGQHCANAIRAMGDK